MHGSCRCLVLGRRPTRAHGIDAPLHLFQTGHPSWPTDPTWPKPRSRADAVPDSATVSDSAVRDANLADAVRRAAAAADRPALIVATTSGRSPGPSWTRGSTRAAGLAALSLPADDGARARVAIVAAQRAGLRGRALRGPARRPGRGAGQPRLHRPGAAARARRLRRRGRRRAGRRWRRSRRCARSARAPTVYGVGPTARPTRRSRSCSRPAGGARRGVDAGRRRRRGPRGAALHLGHRRARRRARCSPTAR